MSSGYRKHSRFCFELATPEDSQELLEILEGAPFEGKISLCYTRRPDAYRSLKKEGADVAIVVCRDLKQRRIVGFGACVIRTLLVNGNAANVGYLFGLRMRPEYFKKYPMLHHGYEFLHTLHKEQGVSFYITTILEENRYVQKLLEEHRPFMPTYQPFGMYEVYVLKTKVTPTSSSFANINLRQATQNDLFALLRFLSENGRNYQFFPVIEEQDLRAGRISGITVEDFYLLCGVQNEILATGVLWDQRTYKQYLVKSYGGLLKLLYPFSRLFPLFGFPALPAPGSILNFSTLSFWAVKGNNPELFRHFLDSIVSLSGEYPFFLIGVHERHPLRDMLQKRPHISYKSKLYLVSWNEQQEYVDKLDHHMVPYLECGML